MVGGTILTGHSQSKFGHLHGSSSLSDEASLFLAFLLLGFCRKPSSALRFKAIRAGSASSFLNPGGTSGLPSRDAHSAAAGPVITADTVSGRLDAVAAANAGFSARLLARRRAGALDSAVDEDGSIFALQASARWDCNGGSTVGWFAN